MSTERPAPDVHCRLHRPAYGKDSSVGTLREAAIVQVVLEGVALPAKKRELLAYARRQQTPAQALAALEGISEREYQTIDEVGEAIAQTQPAIGPRPAHEPKPESGEVPGGASYLDPRAEPGAVRDEPTILPYEEQLVREPAPVGDGIPTKGSKDRKPGKAPARTPSS